MTPPGRPIRFGLRANLPAFALLVGVNALVGAMVGQERALLPLLAREVFGITAAGTLLTFLVAFGVSKAFANLAAGVLADRFGRKPVLVAGWLVGLPVPIMLIAAPDWTWVVAANVLLGINQGLTWSMTVLMKIDLVGPADRGLALGLNEASGYIAVAASALATGLIAEASGLRVAPFALGLVIAGLGLGLSALAVNETRGHVAAEGASKGSGRPSDDAVPSWRAVFVRASLTDRSLSAAAQAGLVNNANDALAWGLLPVFYASAGLTLAEIAILAAAYPATWGVAQVATGALSDRTGRKPPIITGMLVQAAAIGAIGLVSGFGAWLVAAVALGLGTALVYPTLVAVVADVAEPAWRGAAVGVYRLWRDLGFAVGALFVGFAADRLGMTAAIIAVAGLTALSGLIVALRMVETRPDRGARRR